MTEYEDRVDQAKRRLKLLHQLYKVDVYELCKAGFPVNIIADVIQVFHATDDILNTPDETGRTPFFYAVLTFRYDLIDHFLDQYFIVVKHDTVMAMSDVKYRKKLNRVHVQQLEAVRKIEAWVYPLLYRPGGRMYIKFAAEFAQLAAKQ